MQLHLIRHPPVALAAGTCYGRSDVALAGPAEASAERLRPLLPPSFTLISSPLQRCRLLAGALAERGEGAELEPRIQELDFGAWELKTFEDIGRPALDAWAADPFGHCPPGGESARMLAQRVLAALADWQQADHDDLVVVTHGGPARVLLAHLLGLPEAAALRLDLGWGRLCRVALRPRGNALLGFNL